MGLNENECTIDVANIYNLLLLPQQTGNVLNPNYVEPTSENASAWSVQIQYGSSTVEASPAPTTTVFTLANITLFANSRYVEVLMNGQKYLRRAFFNGAEVTVFPALPTAPPANSLVLGWSEFTWNLIGKSVEIEKMYGQKSGASFKLSNENMPFNPGAEYKVRLMNYPDRSYTFFAGYIKSPDPDFIRQRSDLTEKQILNVSCYDLYNELERQLIEGRVYTNQKAGAIIKDLIRNFTSLDASAIDGTAGPTIARFACANTKVSQEVERLMAQVGWTYWIDPNTEKFYVGEPGAITQSLGQVTDTNIHQKFIRNQIKITPKYSDIKTRIIINWTLKYITGTCNVQNGSPVVLGVGTAWDNIPVADLKFQIDGSDAVYSISKNNSAGVTQEFRLSEDYGEADGTAVAYSIYGSRVRRVFTNYTAVQMKGALHGNNGFYDISHTEDKNPYTLEDIQAFANAVLNAMANPTASGEGTTNSHLFGYTGVEAGKTIDFDCQITKSFRGIVVVYKVTMQDTGAVSLPQPDGYRYPVVEYVLGFDNTRDEPEALIRKLQFDVRRVQISDDTAVSYQIGLPDSIAWNDCIHWRKPGSYNLAMTEYDYVFGYYYQSWTNDAANVDPPYVPIPIVELGDTEFDAVTELTYTAG